MPNLILDLEVNRVDLVDEGANSAAFIKLYKRKERLNTMEFEEILKSLKPEHRAIVEAEIAKAKGEVPEAVAVDLAKAKEDLAKACGDAKTANEAVEAATKKAKDLEAKFEAEKAPDSTEEIMKSLDPVVQEVFKSMKLQKETAENVVKQMNEQKITEQAIAKAKELKALPVDEAKLVEIVKSASEEVFEVLKAASNLIESGVQFEEVGKNKGGSNSADAWTKIEKKAGEYKAADEKLTNAGAIAKAIKDNPELYREYLKGGAN